jgi:K+-sensing histidine kinase KdpD
MESIELQTENEALKAEIAILKSNAESVKEYNLLRDRLLNILSHDVHSPLRFSTMVGKAVLTKKDDLNKEEIIDALTDINNTSIRMLLLISNILKWIEYQKGNFTATFMQENLQQMVSDKLEFFRFMANRKQLLLINEIPKDVFVVTDKIAFGVIIQNLINNAVKFTASGEIKVWASNENDGMKVHVSDTGSGMAAETIIAINNGLQISTKADTENMRGNGLGWSLIKELMHHIHGIFEIKSIEGEGTTISILLPAETA